MDSIIINGGNPVIGEIEISGSKNAALPIMTLSILTDEELILTNIPKLSDVITMQKLLLNHGTAIKTIERDNDFKVILSSNNIVNFTSPYDIVRKMRASIWVLGPLLARFGQAKVSLPGGCAIGVRQVDLHIAVMKALGANIEIKDGYILAKSVNKLKGCDFKFIKRSVGATINAISASVLAEGGSNFSNCAIEPEIVDLCNCLISMGAEIYGIGTSDLKIIGKDKLNGCEHNIIPDRIEAGSYMIAAAITSGDVLIKNINFSMLQNLTYKMLEAGVSIEEQGENIRVRHKGNIKSVSISTGPYPEFATDFQAQFLTLMTVATGESEIYENIFENRFMHVPELCRMGADIKVNDNRAIVNGVPNLKGAEIMASDLRASMSLIIAGLAASGRTKISRVYHLDRGYQSLEQKLVKCGIDITRVSGDSV